MIETIPTQVQSEVRRLRALLTEMGRRRSLRDPIFGACESLQMTPSQFHTLMWLGVEGALPMQQLAQRVGITQKTMTGVIDRLEHQGLVTRMRDARDRRVVRVALAAAGRRMFKRLDAAVDHGFAALLSLLSPEDRQQLLGILERLVAGMGERGPSAQE